MTDDEIIKAAREIQSKRIREEKLHDATGEQVRKVTLTFESVSVTKFNCATHINPAVSFQVPYELACTFAQENEEIV
jgi:hypothetical protein